MARIINVGGFTTGRAGVYQDSVQRFEGTSPGFLPQGVVVLAGEGVATTQPKKVYRYKRGADAKLKKELSGDLLEAARILFKPSLDDPALVRGATEVWFIRPNPATQATLDLEDGSTNDLINLTTRDYGIAANGVSALIAAGTDGAVGVKLTVNKFGESSEVKDNIGFNAALIVNYTGDGSTATCQITRTQLLTVLAGDQTDGSVNLTINFSTYDTLEKLSNYINAQTGYNCTVFRNDGATFQCENLDFVGATDCKLATASGSMTLTATATTVTGTLPTGTITGDVIKVGSEYMYVTDAGAKTVIRGYLDTTPAAHSTATGTIHFYATSVNQDVIDYCNNKSTRITAARDTAYNTGRPAAPTTETFFTGGADGTASSSDWDDVFTELKKWPYNFIVCMDNTSSIHSKLATHLDYKWGKGGAEALGSTGAAQGETESQIKVRNRALNDPNITIHARHVNNWVKTDGTKTTLAPWAHACAEIGMLAGMAFGEGLEYKILPFTEVADSFTQDVIELDPELTEWGIPYSDYWDNFYRWASVTSTHTSTDDLEKIDRAVRNSLAFTLRLVRQRVKEKALSRSQAVSSAAAIRDIVEDALIEARDDYKSIVEGSQRNDNGDLVTIPAFELLPFEIDGNVVGFSYRCTPTGSNKFFKGDTFVSDFQDAA